MVHLNDAIEDESKHVENLIRGIFAGNVFDLGSAQVCHALRLKNILMKKIVLTLLLYVLATL